MVFLTVRQISRVITKGCIAIHDIIIIETGGPDTDTSFKIVFNANSDCRYMPVIIPVVLECCTVSCSVCETAGFKAEGHRLRDKRTEGIITHYHTIGITAEFCSRCSILKVIFPVVFSHPGTLNKRVQKSVVHVFAETLPAISPWFEDVQLPSG